MWKRIDFSDWHTMFPKIGFALFAIAFAIIVWRVFKMKAPEVDEASRMPLDRD